MKENNIDIDIDIKYREGKRMAVSKAGVPYMDSYLGNKLIKEIEKTKLNEKLVEDCKDILKNLILSRKR